MKVAALLLTPLLGLLTLIIGVVVVLSPSDSAAAAQCAPSIPVEPDATDLNEHQLANARTIVRVGRQLDVPPRGLVVAVATALQESTLLNLPFGDRDSVGLFQQRDAWAPRAVRMSPSGSATMFYVGGRGGQPGLLDIDGWQQMSIARAAQSVQVSAFPEAYARWESLAVAVVRKVSGLRADCIDAGAWTIPLERGAYTLTARFGNCGGRWKSCHTGLDFAAAPGTPVMAVASGLVTASSTDGAYGNVVRIRHTGGVSTWYAHLQRRIAAPGAQVTAGDVIGFVGSTGNSTGPHLHLEIRTDEPASTNGTPTDPYRWLVEHEATP